ncbi:MAG: hypothetical protein ACKVIG_03905 [Flavobacteriales bacterium]
MKITKLLFCFLLLSGFCQHVTALTSFIDESYTGTINEFSFLENIAVADLNTIALSDDGTDLTVTISGDNIPSSYDLYIDIDNNPATGFNNAGNVLGADFLIQFTIIQELQGQMNILGVMQLQLIL